MTNKKQNSCLASSKENTSITIKYYIRTRLSSRHIFTAKLKSNWDIKSVQSCLTDPKGRIYLSSIRNGRAYPHPAKPGYMNLQTGHQRKSQSHKLGNINHLSYIPNQKSSAPKDPKKKKKKKKNCPVPRKFTQYYAPPR